MEDHGTEFDADCNRKRNLDRRRETSRYAARDRRGKEADIFTDLKEVVPIVEEATVTHVDRIALLRVASTLCRLRKNAAKLLKTNLCEESGRLWSETTLLESLDGFLAIIDSDGVILYITESVSIYLGLTQTDLTGRSLKDFVHASDYEEFAKCGSEEGEEGRMMSIRMKSVISPRGRNLNLKSALFKPVICRIRSIAGDGGRVRVLQGSAQPAGQGSSAAAAAKNAEVPNGTYMTRHTCDMKFSYVSESFNYTLRHEARSLMGTSFYNLVHPADISAVAASMREMLAKGHARTPYYRLIASNDEVIWVQTEATTVNHTSKGHKGQYVICVHDMLGHQGERESFVVSREACMPSVHVKKELDDSPDSRKNSYDEVLQWLFRDRPNSPAPNATLFRAQECQKGSVITRPESSESDPPLAKAALFASRLGLGSPASSADDVTYENSSGSPYTNNAGAEYSPLAAGVADCELRSSGGSSVSGGGGGPIEPGRTTSAAIQSFGNGFSSDPLVDSNRVPTISSADAYSLPNGGGVGSGAVRADMYATLSSTGAQYARPLGYDPYLHIPSTLGGAHSLAAAVSRVSTTATVTPATYKENREDFFENPDLQMLAPFVAHEDMMQLTTDIHGLLPDFNFTDWIPADPAPLQATTTEPQRTSTATNDSPVSPTVSDSTSKTSPISLGATTVSSSSPTETPREGSRSNLFPKSAPFQTPEISPSPKSNTQFSYSDATFTSNAVTTTAVRRVPGTNVESSQWIQQQYRVPPVQTTIISGGCTWTELGVRPNDAVLPFHRDGPAVQQQRV